MSTIFKVRYEKWELIHQIPSRFVRYTFLEMKLSALVHTD